LLAEELAQAPGAKSWAIGDRIEQHLDARVHHHETEARRRQSGADVATIDRRPAGAASARPGHGEIDAIGHGETIDALEDERERERQLELDDDRRLVASCPTTSQPVTSPLTS
jgi:hypothetical protein